MTRLVHTAIAALAVAGTIAGQSLNLDCGSELSSPSAVFGAAADQPGHWNVFEGDTTNPFPLVGLAGEPLAARFVQVVPFGIVTIPLPFRGDTAALLGDFLDLHSIPHTFQITGLESGLYELWFYAWAPDSPAFETAVSVNGNDQLVGGPWPGDFRVGVTHANFDVPVSAGGDISIATFGFGKGTMNGLQLAARELWTTMAWVSELPDALAPYVTHELRFTVDPRDEAIAAGPRLWLRFVEEAGPAGPFHVRRVQQIDPFTWAARIPAAECGQTVELYLEVEGTASGVQHLPLAGALGPLRLPVGYALRQLRFDADFEIGLPAGSVATGLWHVSSSCAPPSCDGGQYLYYGVDATCDYTDGTDNSGVLALPPIDLSVAHLENATAELRFCSLHRTVNDFLGRARVFANGLELLELSQSIDWTEVSVDLTPFVDGVVSIELLFEANHPSATNELGWLVDDLRVEVVERPCPDPKLGPGKLVVAPFDPAGLEPGEHVP